MRKGIWFVHKGVLFVLTEYVAAWRREGVVRIGQARDCGGVTALYVNSHLWILSRLGKNIPNDSEIDDSSRGDFLTDF